MANPRSPVRLKSWKMFGKTFTKWTCDARLQSAMFENRKDPSRTAIVHRSTKTSGKWQGSFFDKDGATSDIQRGSCGDVLRELPPGTWRLRDVSPKR